MNGRIERATTPREDFLVAMFQDDPRLIEALHDIDPTPIELMNELLIYGATVCGAVVVSVVVAYGAGWLLAKVF